MDPWLSFIITVQREILAEVYIWLYWRSGSIAPNLNTARYKHRHNKSFLSTVPPSEVLYIGENAQYRFVRSEPFCRFLIIVIGFILAGEVTVQTIEFLITVVHIDILYRIRKGINCYVEIRNSVKHDNRDHISAITEGALKR